MKIVMLGSPGSGKGTYTQRLVPKLGIPHISTGDLFREEAATGSELGKKLQEIMHKGILVPDDITLAMLKKRLEKKDCENGFILDGYPRNVSQAETLERVAKIDFVINIVVPEEIIIRRLSTRRICGNCGKIYNILSLKPKVEGKCDKCTSELIHRKDDKEEAIKVRLDEYKKRAGPMEDYYKERGVLKNVEWKKELVPEGDIDIPPMKMVELVLQAIGKT